MAPNKTKIQKVSVADMEKYQNGNGLVSMEFLIDYTPYRKGERAGFPPMDARALHNGGIARVAGAPVSDSSGNPVPVPPPSENALIDIPDGWEGFTEVKLVLLAKKFDPEFRVPEGTHPSDRAKAVIQAELDRRAAAAPAGGEKEAAPVA